MDEIDSQGYCQEKLCHAIIKTGKRSGEVCLYRRSKDQMYCGYHSRYKRAFNSTSESKYISKSIQTECLNTSRSSEERIINILNEKLTTSLTSIISDFTNSVIPQLSDMTTIIPDNGKEYKSENHTVHIMSCLTAYMDVQFQTLSEQIQQLREIMANISSLRELALSQRSALGERGADNKDIKPVISDNRGISEVKTKGNQEILEFKKDKIESQRKLEKHLQLYLKKMVKYGSTTENIFHFLKGIDIILSPEFHPKSPSRKNAPVI